MRDNTIPPGSKIQHQAIAEKWTFGVSVVASLAVMIIKIASMLFSLPPDDNGGGTVGALVVGLYDFVGSLLVLEIVRRTFLWAIRLRAK